MAKILLVEDDKNLCEIFEMRLQADGYKTLTAGDGEAALVIAMREKPDLIILDVMMPKMSGFEMLETLRAAPDMAKTKVIMMTALGQAEDQARGTKLGVVKYLVKSQVTLEDFARVVGEVLGSSNGTASAAAGQDAGSNQASSSNNNKSESEQPMPEDNATPTNPSMPDSPADGGGDASPMSSPAAPAGDSSMPAASDDQQSTAQEQSDVQSQVNDFASGAPAAPAGDSSMPAASDDSGAMPSADPAADSPAEHADVPVTPPPADPAGGSSDPMAPSAPADGSGGAPA